MRRTVFEMTAEERQKAAWMMEEGKGHWQMSEKFNLPPHKIEHNIDEILYYIRKDIGLWRFIKSIFIK